MLRNVAACRAVLHSHVAGIRRSLAETTSALLVSIRTLPVLRLCRRNRLSETERPVVVLYLIVLRTSSKTICTFKIVVRLN